MRIKIGVRQVLSAPRLLLGSAPSCPPSGSDASSLPSVADSSTLSPSPMDNDGVPKRKVQQEIFHDVRLETSDEEENVLEGDQELWAACSYRPYVSMTPQYVPRKGFSRYRASLKHLLPIRKKEKKKNLIQIDSAGFFSLLTFSWMSKYIYQAYRQGLTFENIPSCSPYDSGDLNAQRLELLWQDELSRRGPKDASFGRAVWKFIRTRLLLNCFVFIMSSLLGFLSTAIFMRKLIEFTEDSNADTWNGLTWAVAFTLCELIRTVSLTLSYIISYRTAIRLRAACLVMVYRKLIRVNSLGTKTPGEIITLYSSDSGRLFYMVVFGPMVLGGPVVTLCCAFYIYFILGSWALIGMLAFLLFYPLQYLLSRLTGYFRERAIQKTDQRVKLITEVLTTIKLIKMYAWDAFFTKRIRDVREEELNMLQKSSYCQSIGISMAPTIPVISGILTFIIHVLSGGNLTAAQEVLVMEEVGPYVSKPVDNTISLSVTDGVFTWNERREETPGRKLIHEETEKLTEKTSVFTLQSINLCVAKGSLIGICGSVGSGKSSLIHACLGQMKMVSGQLCRSGKCAYVSQESWIENASLKDNVLFGETFDPKRYINTLYCCGLNEDVNYFPAGDDTEIGERGINLSGGQKQRVSLARALYSNRDIYFLDDPLSAVDVQVAAHVFENCILNALSKKTVFLVTHQMKYLQKCDEILVMKDGRIVERGTHHELLSKEREYSFMVMTSTLAQNKMGDAKSDEGSEGSPAEAGSKNGVSPVEKKTQPPKKFTTSEEQTKGEVKTFAYYSYIKAAGGFLLCFIVFMTIFLNVGSTAFSTWWLAIWIKAGSGNTTIVDPVTNETYVSSYINDNPDLNFYLEIYGCVIAVMLLTNLIRGMTFTKVTIRASRVLHKIILDKLMCSRLRHFETTPIGRIQNIFSRDLDEIDSRLPGSIESLIQNIWVMIFAFLFITVVFPWFLLALTVLAVIYYIVGKIFRVAVRDLKRIEAISRSPLFSFITSTISGLPIIHAFNKESDFLSQFCKKFDENSVCTFMSHCAMRWMAFRLDSISVAIALITSLLVVILKGEVAPALAGLALSYSAHISGIFQYTLRLMSETEGRFISVERMLLNVQKLEKEANLKGTTDVSPNWPSQGFIKFQNVILKYSNDLPPVLQGLNFTIKAGEKIGIVGRTGAGKSSLAAALFRLVELSHGTILVDGVDISCVPLSTLRSRLSVIPQDPVIFTGTIRSNLDPYNKHSDDKVWEALRQTKLMAKVQSMTKGLQTMLGDGGDVLSMGESQLLCLARALLRGSKLLILDEATASVDPDTETTVQSTIDENFSQCTILTIAHRLTTIKSCERVLVIDQGMVKEFDNPQKLLEDPNSHFSKMISALK